MVNIINLGVAYINPFFSSMGFLLVCPLTFGIRHDDHSQIGVHVELV